MSTQAFPEPMQFANRLDSGGPFFLVVEVSGKEINRPSLPPCQAQVFKQLLLAGRVLPIGSIEGQVVDPGVPLVKQVDLPGYGPIVKAHEREANPPGLG